MAFMQVKTATFLVGEESFDSEAFFVPITGFTRQFKIGYQKDWLQIASFPSGNDGHRTVFLACEVNIRDADLIPWTNQQINKSERPSIFVKLGVFGGATNVTQAQDPQCSLQFYPIKFAIAQEDRLATCGQDCL